MYREQTTYWSTKEIILKLMPPLPLFEKYFLPSPFPFLKKILWDFVYLCCLSCGYLTTKELFTFNGQPGALECPTHGVGHQASVPTSIFVGHISDVQNLGLGQVERWLLKYQRSWIKLCTLKTQTMQRTTGNLYHDFFGFYFIILKNSLFH